MNIAERVHCETFLNIGNLILAIFNTALEILQIKNIKISHSQKRITTNNKFRKLDIK